MGVHKIICGERCEKRKGGINWYEIGIFIGLVALFIVCVAVLLAVLDAVYPFAAFETLTVLYGLLGIEIILVVFIFIVMLLDERSGENERKNGMV